MHITPFALGCFVAFMPVMAFAQTPPFKDLPPTHSAYEAVMYLREQGI